MRGMGEGRGECVPPSGMTRPAWPHRPCRMCATAAHAPRRVASSLPDALHHGVGATHVSRPRPIAPSLRLSVCAPFPSLAPPWPDPPPGNEGDNANLAQCPAAVSPPQKITNYQLASLVYVQRAAVTAPLTVPYPAFSSVCNDQMRVGYLIPLPSGVAVGCHAHPVCVRVAVEGWVGARLRSGFRPPCRRINWQGVLHRGSRKLLCCWGTMACHPFQSAVYDHVLPCILTGMCRGGLSRLPACLPARLAACRTCTPHASARHRRWT